MQLLSMHIQTCYMTLDFEEKEREILTQQNNGKPKLGVPLCISAHKEQGLLYWNQQS